MRANMLPATGGLEDAGMARLKHPMTGAVYRALDDGTVEVDSNGRKGVFGPDGAHLSGELRIADPHMLLWVGGPQLPRENDRRRHRRLRGRVGSGRQGGATCPRARRQPHGPVASVTRT